MQTTQSAWKASKWKRTSEEKTGLRLLPVTPIGLLLQGPHPIRATP